MKKFNLWPRCWYLNQGCCSAQEYFEKLAFKKTNLTLNGCITKARANSELKANIFGKSIQFSLKQGCFLHAPLTWVHGRGLWPPCNPRCCFQRLAELRAAIIAIPRGSQKAVQLVNNEIRRRKDMIFFVLSSGSVIFWKHESTNLKAMTANESTILYWRSNTA